MATFTQRCTLHANSGTASAVGGDYSAGTYLYVGDQSASFYDYLSYIRFTSVDIPAGSLINSATLNLTAGVLTSAVVITTVKAEAADNPAACSSAADVNGRTLTIASTNWDPSAWVVNTAYDSPDIASVIQEVVNRNRWVSGNAMQLFWSTRSTGWGGSNTLMGTYPDTGNGPLLTIDYTPRLGFDLRGPVPPGLRSPRTMRVVAGNTVVGSTAYTRAPADLIGLLDTAARTVAYTRASGDLIGLLDTAARTVAYTRAPADLIGLLDAASRALSIVRAPADLIGLLDATTRTVTYKRTPADLVGLTDARDVISVVGIAAGPITLTIHAIGHTGSLRNQVHTGTFRSGAVRSVWARGHTGYARNTGGHSQQEQRP